MFEHEDFKVGDIVTRAGDDLQLVIKAEPGDNCITVRCIRAPASGWCKVGDEEYNLTRRYGFPDAPIDGVIVRDPPALPAP